MSSETARRVVIIDDDDDIRFVIERHLNQRAGFCVVAQGFTGADAMALTAEHSPDVLLLDLGLPDVPDDELISQLVVASPRMMIAVITGRAAEERETLARTAGAFSYYEKHMIGQRLLDHLEADCQLFDRALAGEDIVAPSATTRRDPPTGQPPAMA